MEQFERVVRAYHDRFISITLEPQFGGGINVE